jgi:hypothetical protein
MDWQFTLTCLTIAVAGGFVLWRGLQTLRSLRGGCSGGCGCSRAAKEVEKPVTMVAPEELSLRKR